MTVSFNQSYTLQDTDLNALFYSNNLLYSPVSITYEYGYMDQYYGYLRIGPVNRVPIELSVGKFRPNFSLDSRAHVGTYKLIWKYKDSEDSAVQERIVNFYVVTEGLYDYFVIRSTYDTLRVKFHKLTNSDIFNKFALIPDFIYIASLNVVSGTAAQNGVDYTTKDRQVSWKGLRLEAELAVGDTLRVIYVAQDVVRNLLPPDTLITLSYTILSQDVTNRYVTISDTIYSLDTLKVNTVPYAEEVDYFFYENRIYWGMLGLDGIISAGDTLEIKYVKDF